MDIGEMKQRIEFMVEENVSDGQGGYDTTLVSKGSTWAKVTNIHGGEYFLPQPSIWKRMCHLLSDTARISRKNGTLSSAGRSITSSLSIM